jgi:hypothetical protein
MCHICGTFLEIFDVSFPFIDSLCTIYKSTSIFLGPYIIMFGLHFPFHDMLSINIVQVNDNTFLLYTCRYATLWIAPIVLVGYSFGGLVLKSLVVDVHKRIYQKVANEYEIRTKINCKRFLDNLKGTIFYGVPHTGGPKELLEYFTWQSQEMNSPNKKLIKAQPSLLNNIESFNRQMEQLTVDFDHAIEANVNIYAFVEGKPLNQNGVHSKDSTTLTLFQII